MDRHTDWLVLGCAAIAMVMVALGIINRLFPNNVSEPPDRARRRNE